MMKIDLVLPWVDGDDPSWKEKRAQYQPKEGDNIHPARYRDWGLLKYIFRGIEQYVPWINHIWFVCDGQVPSWLNTAHPKLSIVSQNTILPESCIPSFNINAIELNVHRIPGLSEHFIYMNDDMFFLRPVSESSFFRNGLPCDTAILNPVIVTRRLDVGSIMVNNLCLINTHFDKAEAMRKHFTKWFHPSYGAGLLRTCCMMPWRHFPGFFNPHLPQAFLKSTFEEVWAQEGQRLSEVTSHRFRNNYMDVNQWLVRYWQLCKGDFCPTSGRNGKDLDVNDLEKVCSVIKNQSYSYVCINDDERIQSILKYKQKIKAAFERILGQTSLFEKH